MHPQQTRVWIGFAVFVVVLSSIVGTFSYRDANTALTFKGDRLTMDDIDKQTSSSEAFSKDGGQFINGVYVPNDLAKDGVDNDEEGGDGTTDDENGGDDGKSKREDDDADKDKIVDYIRSNLLQEWIDADALSVWTQQAEVLLTEICSGPITKACLKDHHINREAFIASYIKSQITPEGLLPFFVEEEGVKTKKTYAEGEDAVVVEVAMVGGAADTTEEVLRSTKRRFEISSITVPSDGSWSSVYGQSSARFKVREADVSSSRRQELLDQDRDLKWADDVRAKYEKWWRENMYSEITDQAELGRNFQMSRRDFMLRLFPEACAGAAEC